MKNTNGLFFIFSIFLLAYFSGDFLFGDEAEDPGNFGAGNPIIADDINQRFLNLYNTVNGLIGNDNLKSDEASLAKVSGGAMTSSGGNIGIGTSNTEDYKLYVNNGDLMIKNSGNAVLALQSTDTATIFDMVNDGGGIDEKIWQIVNFNGELSFRSRKDDRSSKYYILQLLADGNTYVIGNMGVGTDTPTARLEVDGYTKLGTDAPAVKMKRLTGTTSPVLGGQVITSHGLDATKIICFDAVVHHYDDAGMPPEYSRDSGYTYHVYYYQTDFKLQNGSSADAILEKPFEILVWYTE